MNAGKKILAVFLSATMLFTATTVVGLPTATAVDNSENINTAENKTTDVNISVSNKKIVQQSNSQSFVNESKVSNVEKYTSNPTVAGKLINNILDQPTYDEALRTVLDSYYAENNKSDISALEKAVDPRGDKILSNYSNAYKQREKSPDELGFMSGEILAVTKQGVKAEEVDSLLSDERMTVQSVTPYGNNQQLVKLNISLEYTVEQAMAIVEKNPYVDYVQKDNVYTTQQLITEDFVDDNMAGMQYYLDHIKALDCWDTFDTVYHEKIKVAVIDTGVDINHEDLTNVLNKDLSVRVTADGAISPLTGDNGTHGTHVSGIIAAQSNNSIGTVGVGSATDNNIIDLIGIGCDIGNGNSFTTICVYRAIRYAVENGVRVINLSLGGRFDEDNMFQEAVTLAVNSGCVVVCASGNAYSSDYFYPSDCDGVISVIALDESGTKKANFSNYGGKNQKVSAFGVDIYSTIPNNEYEAYSGTSMASPIVAAVAAMVLSANPSLTVEQVKDIIFSSCTDLGEEGYDIYFGYGRVNAYEAIQKALNDSFVVPESVKLSNSKIELYKGESTTIKAKVIPAEANQQITYFTRNDSVCTVSQEGVITGKSTGTTEIVVATTNGILEKCIVTVADHGTTKLAKPTAETVQLGKTTGSVISWNPVENADYYQIYSALTENGEYSCIGSTYDTEFTIDVGRTAYARPAKLVSFYKIKAVSNSKAISDSKLSDSITYVYVGQNPEITLDLIWHLGKGQGFFVHWSAITSSQLYRTSKSDPNPKLLGTFGTDSNLNFYYDNDVVVGETYTYTLKLFTEHNGIKYGDVTGSVTETYLGDDPVDTSFPIPHINSVTYENGKVSVNRDGGSFDACISCVYISDDNGVSWYEIERVIYGDEYPLTTELDFDFKPNTTYMIKCKNRAGISFETYVTSSHYSSTVYMTTPKELSAPVLTAKYDGSAYVDLSWNSCGKTGYYTLYRRSGSTGEWQIIGNRLNYTNYSDFRGGDDQLYFYKVVYTDPNTKATFVADSNIVTESISTQSPYSNVESVRTGTDKRLLAGAEISPIDDVVYSNNMKAPKFTVTYRGETLVQNVDYSVANMNYNRVGRACVVIYGLGNYIGEKAVYYNVLPPDTEKFNVTYVDYDNSIISTQTVEYGENAIVPSAPKRTGYVFAGWNKSNQNIKADTTIKATYSKKENAKYQVKFVDRNGNVIFTETVEKGGNATPPTPPTLSGYKFVKWINDYTNITCNTTIKAEYKATRFESGSGTKSNPYIISNREQLDYMSYVVRTYGGSYSTAYYELSNDIVYNDVTDFNSWGSNQKTGAYTAPLNKWIPIGTYNSNGVIKAFKGSFDGKGHQIAGLFCEQKQDYVGLFGCVQGATITNVGLYLGYFKATANCGGLVGAVLGDTAKGNNIRTCYVKECIIYAKAKAGGLIGSIISTQQGHFTGISDSYAKHCIVYTSTLSPTGGFIGYVESIETDLYVENCYAYCDTTCVDGYIGATGNFVGEISIANYSNSPIFTNCYTWDRNYTDSYGCVTPEDYEDKVYLDIALLDNSDDMNNPYTYTNFDFYIPDSYPEDTEYIWIDNSMNDDTPSLYFEKDRYAVAFYIDEELYAYQLLTKGDAITIPDEPTRDGCKFSGWGNIPSFMPGENLEFTGSFTENVYKISYYINDYLYNTKEYFYGDTIEAPEITTADKYFTGWIKLPESMPDDDIAVYAYTGVYGDATNDGKTSLADALMVMKYIVGSMKLTNKAKGLCDYNKDGKITLADALAIQKYIISYR